MALNSKSDFEVVHVPSFGSPVPHPERVWPVVKPCLIYGEYLFRRIFFENGIELVRETIITRRFNDYLFGEHPNHLMCSSLATVYTAVMANSYLNNVDKAEYFPAEFIEAVVSGGLPWDHYQDSVDSDQAGSNFLGRGAVTLALVPYLYKNIPGLLNNKDYKEDYESCKPYSSNLDVSRNLEFCLMVLKWKLLARKVRQWL